MKTETIIKYYNDNDLVNIKDYHNRLVDNIKEVSRMVFKYFIYLILIIFVYYLLEESTLTSLKIGIVEISDLKVLKIFIPPLFAIVYLVVFVGEYRREQLMHQAKVLFNMINKTDLKADDLERHHFNDFNISFLPFYLPAELTHKLTVNKFWDIIGVFTLVIFYLVLGGALYVFEYFILKELFEMWSENFLVKSVFVITCTMVFISFFFFFKIVFTKQREEKADKEFWDLIAEEQRNN
ncbi:hypothetical protein [Plebeiibacterium sediminum]|uniref:Uncharacterized protein n=1 Tax=Plebeiibacterium sediminum TaxID=2992112 RepID=A0AAE3M9V8_9BACT|nr:hypothetical protein [Plebeiobacterium sediminum]MCW3789743.1 hypothetical protein [Plebeiobacterium sediminum]